MNLFKLKFEFIMKITFAVWTILTAFTLACNSSPTESANDKDSVKSNSPVESRNKVAPNQQPAFNGQTRVAGIKTHTKIIVSVLAKGLHHPWGLEFMPNGKLIVSERTGNIRIISPIGEVGKPLANVPPARQGGDAGLLDLKLDPNFASTRLIFWSYVQDSGGMGRNIVARARLSDDETTLENVTIIFRGTSPYAGPNHNGSRMIFDTSGLLYVTFGERFDDSIRLQAQELNSSLGKIIRITKDGKAAAGNPFFGIGPAHIKLS